MEQDVQIHTGGGDYVEICADGFGYHHGADSAANKFLQELSWEVRNLAIAIKDRVDAAIAAIRAEQLERADKALAAGNPGLADRIMNRHIGAIEVAQVVRGEPDIAIIKPR